MSTLSLAFRKLTVMKLIFWMFFTQDTHWNIRRQKIGYSIVFPLVLLGVNKSDNSVHKPWIHYHPWGANSFNHNIYHSIILFLVSQEGWQVFYSCWNTGFINILCNSHWRETLVCTRHKLGHRFGYQSYSQGIKWFGPTTSSHLENRFFLLSLQYSFLSLWIHRKHTFMLGLLFALPST